MKQIWIITKRELKSFFNSLMAYIMLIAFLGFSGFFTWLFGSDVFMVGQASLQSFFGIAYWTLFFFIPALTMGLIAEETRSGTIEQLLTKPVNNWQVLGGKFLSTLLLIMIALALTIPYYITVSSLGPVDHGAVWTGYLGLILMSAMYISIGVFASSISNNQIIGFLLALFIGLFFHIIFGILSSSSAGIIGKILNYLSMQTHFESISRGVIDTKDLVYFLSIIAISLFSAESILTKRKV
ncbi:ABC transporter permease subunit [Bacteroidota bacterium]